MYKRREVTGSEGSLAWDPRGRERDFLCKAELEATVLRAGSKGVGSSEWWNAPAMGGFFLVCECALAQKVRYWQKEKMVVVRSIMAAWLAGGARYGCRVRWERWMWMSTCGRKDVLAVGKMGDGSPTKPWNGVGVRPQAALLRQQTKP